MSANIILTEDLARKGFLRDYMESSTDYPDGKTNGDCIVHFTGDYAKYEMHAKLVDGKKEGNAVMLNDGVLYLKLTFAEDQLTGPVDRLNKFGFLSLHGNLVDGVETGVFMEYDKDRKVIWRGYYLNGFRFSEITRSDSMRGFYEERNVSTGVLLTIAQYDEELHDKNGKCFEMVDDEVKREVLYENGAMKRTVREFVNGNMLVYDESGEKIYEGAYRGDMKEGYLVHEPMADMEGFFKTVDATGQITSVSEYEELNVKRNGKCFELEDGKVKRVCIYEKDQLMYVMMEFCGNVMIEYDGNGMRVYEGGFKGNMKTGYMREGEGKEYMNGSKTAVYSGYFRNGKREGLGTEFKGFSPLYSGEWMKGRRHGKGEEMDENGRVVRSGIWVEGVHESEKEMVMVPDGLAYDPSTIEELTIADHSWCDNTITELKVEYQHALKRIQIGNECFCKVTLFELTGLSQLESLEVGEKCFTGNQSGWFGLISRSESACRIVNCPKLQSIVIGDHSFEDNKTLELKYLFALRSVQMGKNCFWWTPSLLLTDMPQLTSVSLGAFAFLMCQSVVFENLPQLQSITLGWCTFYGDTEDEQKATDVYPFNFKNMLVLKNLPALTELKGEGHNFHAIGSVVLEQIPKLESEGIGFDDGCFSYTYDVESVDATGIEAVVREKSNHPMPQSSCCTIV